jgi:hypothetical protein
MSLKPSDIDHITKLLTQIAEALIKNDFPTNELSLSMAKEKYVNSTIKPLQKKLRLYLAPLWPEILRLSDQRQLRQDIEVFLNIKDINEIRRSRVDYIGNSILKNKTEKLVDELQCIKATLEYQQGTKPAETGQNATLAKIWACIKRIPRWIYVLVIFLAALLTCIYFLWWLWATFWKK